MNELFENKTRLLEEDLEAIMKVLKIGKVESSGGEEDSHGHNHRRRRSAGSLLSSSLESKTSHSVHRREVDDHADAHALETGTVRNIVIDLPFNFQDLIVNSPL